MTLNRCSIRLTSKTDVKHQVSLHKARRRYIDIRYFWLKQYLDSNVLRLVYCPSRVMYADVLASVRSGREFADFVRRMVSSGPYARERPTAAAAEVEELEEEEDEESN